MLPYVLDASSLLALILREAGGEKVIAHLEEGIVSSVNFSEVIAVLIRQGNNAKVTVEKVRGLELQIISFDEVQAQLAAELMTVTQRKGLSFADRACLALAFSRKLPVLTADRAWADLEVGVKIELIR